MGKNTNTPAAAPAATAAPEIAAPDAPDEVKTEKVKARVLVASVHGKVNDVVEVTAAEAEASDELDAHPDAVAYAEGLAAEAEAE
jgi:hypothetical protein